MQTLEFEPIGYIHSCYQEKFGIPRQPGLVTATKSQLILNKEFDQESVLVRPPRLGGNKKVGVFASRSTFRPNPIGMSVVELIEINNKKSRVVLSLEGCDLLNNTPILDIKPYLPYVDAIPKALGGFAQEKPDSSLQVYFSDIAAVQCKDASIRLGENIELVISQILALDPKPSYQRNEQNFDRIYRMKLYDFDLSWQYCENNKIKVLAFN